MEYEKIRTRIEELEGLKTDLTRQRAEKLAEVEIKKSELNEVQRQADSLNWFNRPEARELDELNIVIKYIKEN